MPPFASTRTRRSILAATGLAGLAATACGAATKSTSPAEAPSGPRVKQGTTLQWMYWSSPGPWIEANQKEAAAFEAKYAPQALKIEQMNVPSGQPFLDKLTSLLAGGSPPDIAEIMPWDVPQYQAKRLLLNLSPLQKRDKYDLTDFFPAGFDQYRWTADGKPGGTSGDLYGVPRDFPTRALVYNVDAFKEVGAKVPAPDWTDPNWNLNAFLDAALKVVKRGDGPNGVSRWAWTGHEGLQEWMPGSSTMAGSSSPPTAARAASTTRRPSTRSSSSPTSSTATRSRPRPSSARPKAPWTRPSSTAGSP